MCSYKIGLITESWREQPGTKKTLKEIREEERAEMAEAAARTAAAAAAATADSTIKREVTETAEDDSDANSEGSGDKIYTDELVRYACSSVGFWKYPLVFSDDYTPETEPDFE